MAIKIKGDTIIDDGRVIVNADKIGIGTTNPHVALEIFNGDVGIGTTNPDAEVLSANTSKLAVGILTANQIFGPITGALNPTGSVIIDENLTVNGNTILGDAASDTLTVNATPTFKENATFEKDVQIDGVLTYEDVTNVDSIGLITARNGIHVLAGAGISIVLGGLNVSSGISTLMGNVGIGTKNPDAPIETQNNTKLAVAGIVTAYEYWGIFKGSIDAGVAITKADTVQITDDTSGSGTHYIHFGDQIGEYDGVEVDSEGLVYKDGNIGIGTSNPTHLMHVHGGDVHVDVAAPNDSGLGSPFVGTRYNNGTHGSILFLQHSRGTTIGTKTPLVADDEIGVVAFRSFTPNGDLHSGAFMKALVSETSTSNDGVPADLLFGTGTTLDDADEKLRITSAGNVGIGTSVPNDPIGTQNNVKLAVAGIVTAYEYFGTFKGTIDPTAGPANKIQQGDTKAEVVDTGTDGHFFVETDGTQKLKIDNNEVSIFSSHLLIDSDAYKLKLGDSQDLQLWHDGSENYIQSFVGDINYISPTDSSHSFQVNSVEKLRITSAGNVGIGTSVPNDPIGTQNNVKLAVAGIVTAYEYWGDGSNLTGITADGGNVATSIQTFTTAGTYTYTPTSGTTSIIVYVIGAGGASGTPKNYAWTGGGGAGGVAIKTYNLTQLGANASVIVPAATGYDQFPNQYNGPDGGDASFNPSGTGPTITGYGGKGSSAKEGGGSAGSNQFSEGGDGGAASNGDINYTGEKGVVIKDASWDHHTLIADWRVNASSSASRYQISRAKPAAGGYGDFGLGGESTFTTANQWNNGRGGTAGAVLVYEFAGTSGGSGSGSGGGNSESYISSLNGTSEAEFTNIPSWATKITLIGENVLLPEPTGGTGNKIGEILEFGGSSGYLGSIDSDAYMNLTSFISRDTPNTGSSAGISEYDNSPYAPYILLNASSVGSGPVLSQVFFTFVKVKDQNKWVYEGSVGNRKGYLDNNNEDLKFLNEFTGSFTATEAITKLKIYSYEGTTPSFTYGLNFTGGTVTAIYESGSGGSGGGFTDKIEEGNTKAEVIDTGTDGHFLVETEGTERLRIIADGNVGIGSTIPQTKLDVNGALTVKALNLDTTGAGDGDILSNGGPDGIFGIFNTTNSGQITFTNKDSGGTNNERLRIGSAGQIGLGGANYGTSGQVLTSGGPSAAPSWEDASGGGSGSSLIRLLPEQTATSETEVVFDNIPSDALEITLMLTGVSASGTNNFKIQLGTASGYITSGYDSLSQNEGGQDDTPATDCFLIKNGSGTAGQYKTGSMVIKKTSSTSYVQTGQFAVSPQTTQGGNVTYGSLSSVSGTVDRLKVILSGSDTFDAGTISVSYKTSGGSATTGSILGQIVSWAGSISNIPSEYVLCDGRELDKTTYSELFALLGTIHNVGGEPSNVFRVPDLRDRFVVGAHSDGIGGTYPQLQPASKDGNANGALPSHYHNMPGDDQLAFANGQTGGTQNSVQAVWSNTYDNSFSYDATSTNTGNGRLWRTTTVGSSTLNTNLPPYYALAYIINVTGRTVAADGSGTTKVALIRHVESSGTNGGAATVAGTAFNTRKLNDLGGNIGATLSNNIFSLPAGTYKIDFTTPFYHTSGSQSRLKYSNQSDVVSGTLSYIIGSSLYAGPGSGGETVGESDGHGIITLTETNYFILESKVAYKFGTYDFGIASNYNGDFSGTTATQEVYSQVRIEDLTTAVKSQDGSTREYSVLDHGVVADDSTDNTTAYSNLISIAPEGSTIKWPPGTYRGHFISSKSFNLIGGPNVILKPITDDSSNTNAILQFTGTEDSAVTLSAQPVFGSDQISHSSGTLAVGDIVRLWDGYGRPSDGQEVNKELVKVRVATNSGVTKIHGTILSNQNNGTYTYVKLNTLKNIKIQNFRFELGTSTPAGIYCRRCENVENINIHVTGGKGASIYMRDVYNCYTSDTSRTNAFDVTSGYGYHYQNYIVKYSRVEHTRGHVTRHVIDNDSTYMLSVKGAYATQSGGTPFLITHNSFGGFQHWENLHIENTLASASMAASADGLGQNTAAKRASEILRNVTIKDYYDRSNTDSTNSERTSIYIQYQCKNLVLKDIVIIEDGTLSGNAADADIGQKAIRFSGPIGGSSSIQNVHAEGRPIVMMFDSDAQSGNHTYAQDFPRNGETLRIRNITCRTNIKKIFYFKSPANGSTGSYYMYFDIGDVRAMVGSSAFGTNGANWHSYVHIPSATTNGQGKFELDQIPEGMGTGANKVVVNSGGFLLYFHSLKNSMSASLTPTSNTLFQSDMISAGSPAGRLLSASTINVLEKPCGYGQVARFQCGGIVTFNVSAINASSGNADLSTVDGNNYIAAAGDFIALVSLDADSWRIWKDGTWSS